MAAPSPMPGQDHDQLVFLDEEAVPATASGGSVWRVLIVDDDEDVHSTTTFALGSLEMQHRPLEFLHAYSASEARQLLGRERDIAVVLLDVVMERDDAGLALVRHIRETLGLHELRIILRTGQPGYAPEIDAIRDYDINDYKTKSELTRIKLYTAVTAAIRSYEQITAINRSRQGMDRVLNACTGLMALNGARDFGAGVLEQACGLLRATPSGVLCAKEPAGDGHLLHALAAAGPHAALGGGLLTAVRGGAIHAALEQALGERRTIVRDDSITLYIRGKSKREFAAHLPVAQAPGSVELRLLDIFASHVAVGLDNVELVSHLHNAAFYDQLSKLPNRARLVELLDGAMLAPARARTTLALVDIDDFAETNDALGHHFGDLLLVAVAGRLQARLGLNLVLARIGSDTFAVLGDASAVNPERILPLFDIPFTLEGQDVQISATLGLVRLGEHEGTGGDALKDADIALKRAKSQKRSGHFYFTRSMGVEIRERVSMMHALRAGFAGNELSIVYQPQIDLESRRTVGAEALLRWQTRDGQFISPDRFIPIAEYSGLIIEIGEWVLREACRELVRLRACGHRDFTISINVSQVQFRHPYFLHMLQRALADTGAPPQHIELEITESMAMEEPDLLIRVLAQVKQTGVSIAIDDFGTGFSSLSHLQRLQVDRLKIDRTFVTEITGSARGSSIAEMVVQLGRNLGLSIVAEGVEDERQAQVLSALGCPLAQGFLFAKPLPAPALADWLATAVPAG
ncbi:EAL domain-containing protein [Pseudoduganella sp. GCM10020061]|uniref:EAL domain-containing response regulator n=1 Tax=Pseudoduganella sp. GCM10020061 TaxID=3317345 RepID=UPI003642D420